MTNILLAPLYFHFGDHWWFLEITSLTSAMTESVLFYFVLFVVTGVVSFYRNSTFQSYTIRFFKFLAPFFNRLPFSAYIAFYFNSFVNVVSFLVDIFYLFFKKKNK